MSQLNTIVYSLAATGKRRKIRYNNRTETLKNFYLMIDYLRTLCTSTLEIGLSTRQEFVRILLNVLSVFTKYVHTFDVELFEMLDTKTGKSYYQRFSGPFIRSVHACINSD